MTRYAHHSGGFRSAGRAVGLAMALVLCLSGCLSDPPAASPPLSFSIPACLSDPPAASPPLSFSLREGCQINAFCRQGAVGAHFVLGSCWTPRLVVAFSAGNSGVGLWFDDPAVWGVAEKVEAVSRKAEGGGQLHGVTA